MASYVGNTLEVKTKNGTFEGVLIDLHIETTGSKKITLNKVKVKQTGKRLRTPCHFYSNEILDLKVVNASTDKDKKADASNQQEPVNNNNDTENRTQSCHSDRSSSTAATAVRQTTQSENGAGPDQNRSHHVRSPAETSEASWQELKSTATKGYILIDKIGKNFRRVIQHLKDQHFVGLSVSGVNIGRRGELHLVQIYADEIAFLFDFKTIGTALFNYERGNIGEILESHSVVKVVHDSRWMSDLFHHRFGIPLNCIYDTQVADVLITRHDKHGELPRYSRALPECLLEYLEISISEVFSKMVHSRLEMAEELLWEERPLNPELLESAMRNVRYLLDLRVATLRRLMGELMCATHIYLSCVRDVPETTGMNRGQDPSLVPRELSNFFRRGLRGMSSSIYEDFQLGSVGGGDGPKAKGNAVPWDLWQPGQKLNPSLHNKSRDSQFADAPTSTSDQAKSTGDTNPPPLSQSPMRSDNQPLGNGMLSNGLPGGAEESRLTDEESDSDDEDVFGGDSDVFAWRRQGPTVEGQEEDSTLGAEKEQVEVSKPHVSETFKNDQNLYASPVVKCATDLYNLPVNGLPSSSTEEDLSPVEDTEEVLSATVKEETVSEPIQWPGGEGVSDFVTHPAGLEEGTLFEALPSPMRHVTSVSKVSTAKQENAICLEESAVQRANANGVENSSEPPPLTRINGDASIAEVNSHGTFSNSYSTETFDHSNRQTNSTSSFSKGAIPKSQRPDQERYRPPRMRNIPPRFRKGNANNVASLPDQYSSYRTQSNLSPFGHVVNDAQESGSESSSSTSSSASGSSNGQQRSNQGAPNVEMQNAPATFGEMMAQLSDQGRDSDSSLGETSNGRRQRSGGSGHTTSSETSEDQISKYDEIVAARVSGTKPKGRGRARALHAPADTQRERRMQRERVYGTPLYGSEVRMDFPSEYEIQHAPRAVPIRAGSNLLSVKTIGRGISHM